MDLHFLFFFVSSLLASTLANPRCGRVRTVFQYPIDNTFIENIAIQRNGSILFTSVANPGGIHMLDPFTGSPPVFVGAPDGYNATLGIVEGKADIFYFVAQNYNTALGTASFGTVPGSNSIWRLDLTLLNLGLEPEFELLARLPEAQSLNGLTKFNDTLLLAGDCKLGAVWAIDTESGEYRILAQDPLMAPPATTGFQQGINGLRFVRDWWDDTGAGRLYFTNSQTFSFASLELDEHGQAVDKATNLASATAQDGLKTILWDDFAVDHQGEAWIATENGNSIQRLRRDRHGWTAEVVAGSLNSTRIAEPTSAAFGRTSRDENHLYVTTGGGFAIPIIVNNKRVAMGAQVLSVDVSTCQRW